MKKHFVTFAAAAAMASPLAIMADANAEWFDIYGRVHTSMDMEAYDDDAGDSGDLVLHDRSSFFGARGNRDLDGGVNVFYQTEWNIQWHNFAGIQEDFLDSQGAGMRDTFVGFRSDGFGQLRFGRLPYGNAIVYGGGANFFPTQAGDVGAFINAVTPFGGRAGLGHDIADADAFDDDGDPIRVGTGRASDRSPAVLEYTAPIDGPLGVIVTFAPSAKVDEDGDALHEFMVRGSFVDGPLNTQVTLAQHHVDETDDSAFVYALQGSFDMGGGMRVGGGLVGVSHDEDDSDDMVVWGGGSMQMTPAGTVKAQIAQYLGDASDTDSTALAVGYDHSLGATTTVYSNLVFTSNDDGASYTSHNYASSAPTHEIDAGEDATVISFGVVQTF